MFATKKKKKVWQVVAYVAKQYDYNDRLYLFENSNNAGDTIHITVGNNLSKLIKTFNINREIILIPVHFIVCVTFHECEVNKYDKSSICKRFTYHSTSSIFFQFALFSHFLFYFSSKSLYKNIYKGGR